MLFRQLHKLPTVALEALAAEARSEGYRFLDRLRDEWESGVERFDGRGEKLIGAFDGERLVGIGGVHADPYAAEPRIGRLRRIYVAPGVRRSGFASNLVATLLVDAGLHFDIVRLRVPDDRAARFYEKLGFEPVSIPNASHILKLADRACYDGCMHEHVRQPSPATSQAAEGLPRRSWTMAEIEAMVAAGIIAENERFELIGGEIVPMSPKGRSTKP